MLACVSVGLLICTLSWFSVAVKDQSLHFPVTSLLLPMLEQVSAPLLPSPYPTLLPLLLFDFLGTPLQCILSIEGGVEVARAKSPVDEEEAELL